jgi:hypothetical protein
MACEDDKIPVAPLITITLVGIHVCLVVAFGVGALLGMAERDAEATRSAAFSSPYAASMADQRAAVQGGSEGGMSVDRAMDRIVRNQEGQ